MIRAVHTPKQHCALPDTQEETVAGLLIHRIVSVAG